ncbi:hypothetical protein QWZ13_08650 [Reinekea marina]|uniref:hypothetical protein n=1 Tax=Reinekea marina TaxID=1310421 RepID=UPI0025B441EB|nr:hypothetical protein [Reinekea marina]MDN3648978.1 hypothetical protein [Reinekea marina]
MLFIIIISNIVFRSFYFAFIFFTTLAAYHPYLYRGDPYCFFDDTFCSRWTRGTNHHGKFSHGNGWGER